MFDLSPEKLLLLGAIALMVMGPERLPKAARNAARVLSQLRNASMSMTSEVRDALAEPRQVIDDAVSELGLPAGLGRPKIPTAKGFLTQALLAPSSTDGNGHANSSDADPPDHPVTRYGDIGPSSHTPLPDDPGLN